ncbi:MAG: UDP-N-acetylmuramoyl-tripeptide--D-alanyl-D-alanine ligase [Alphaproteobacteria bacterium]
MRVWGKYDLSKALSINITQDIKATGFSIDSRSIEKGEIFMALKSAVLDGHDFVEDAFLKGASAAIVEKDLCFKKAPILHVPSVMSAIQHLGLYARSNTNSKIVAITGSAGKTTVKEWTGRVLSRLGKTVFAKKSYNNHLGVPLSLANLSFNTEFGVFEIGMNQKGEISPLSLMIRPDIAVITTLSEAHIGYLGSLESIIFEKVSIVDGLECDGVLIIPYEFKNAVLSILNRKNKKLSRIITVGSDSVADIYLKYISKEGVHKSRVVARIDGEDLVYDVPFQGNYFVYNTLILLGILKELGVPIKNASMLFSDLLKPLKGRGCIKEIQLNSQKKILLIDDSYNANFLSIRSSLERLKEIKPRYPESRVIIVLGEMLELGDESYKYHKDLLPHILNAGVHKVFAIGDAPIKNLFDSLPKDMKGGYFKSINDILSNFEGTLKDRDILLIKGSNKSAVFKLVDFLEKI